MDESTLNIVVDGDASGGVQAFDSMDTAVNQFGGDLDGLKARMTSPYEHAGLFLFSRQVLGLAGLSDVARHAMGAITLGFEEVAVAAGTTVAEIAPYLLAIGLIIVGIEKFVKSHKDAKQSTDDLVKSEDEELKSTRATLQAFDDYAAAGGRLTPELAAVKVATDNLYQSQTRLMALDLQHQLDETNAAIAKIKDSFAPALNATAGYAAELDKYQTGSAEAATATTAVTHVLDEHAKSTAALDQKVAILQERLKRYADTGDLTPTMDKVKTLTDDLNEQAASVAELGKVWQKNADDVNKAADQMLAGQTKLSTDTQKMDDEDAAFTQNMWDKKSAAAKKSMDQTLASIEQTYKKAKDEAEGYGIEDVGLTNQYEAAKAAARKLYMDKSDADARAFFGLQATMTQGFEQIGISSFNQLANGVSSSFAKMVVEGKNMAVSLDQVFKSMAESFITAVGDMMIKWLAFKAVMGVVGAAAPGAGGAFAGLPGMDMGGGGLTVPGFANGGDFLATHPTLIAVGDAGPERVTIVPSGMSAPSGSGGSSGGGGDTYNISVPVSGAGDPDTVAQKVVQYLLQQTKGRGQVNSIGPSIYGR